MQSFYEAFDAGNVDVAASHFAEHAKMRDPELGSVEGRGVVRDYLAGLKGPVPDARAVVERILEAGDTVVVEGRFQGTNTGPLPGEDGELPPSGRPVDLPFADFSRVADGLIVEYHTYYDQVGLMRQLGLMD